jgi:hypothetical protein
LKNIKLEYSNVFIFLKSCIKGVVLWCLTLLSTIFLLYSGGQFYWCRKPPTCRKSLTNFIAHNAVYLTTSVVIGTDCIGSCKSSYHTITATTAPGIKCVYTCIKTNLRLYFIIIFFKSCIIFSVCKNYEE